MTPADYRAFTVTSNNGLLREITALVKVALAESLATMFKLNTPPVDVLSLWDTGATSTSISKRLVSQLQLPPISKAHISCAGQPYESNVYMVDLHLPNGVTVKNVKVTEFENNNRFDVLVGMDIITRGDFAITNAGGKTVCSFRMPSEIEHIDYVGQSRHKSEAQAVIKRFKKKSKKRH